MQERNRGRERNKGYQVRYVRPLLSLTPEAEETKFPGCHLIPLKRKTVQLLSKRTTRIHPAIDFVKGKAFVGLFLPTEVKIQPKKKQLGEYGDEEERPEVREEDHLWLISSDRTKLIYAGDYQHLRGEGYVLTNKPLGVSSAPRWDLSDLADWLTPKEGALSRYPTLEPDSVYIAVRDAIAYYMEFPDPRDLDFWTLMVIHTYFARLFNACPIGYVGGIKRTGKTKLLMIISLLGFNSVLSASLSTAFLFRIIQDARATLLIDETETLFDAERNQALRAIILAAYKKGQAAHRVEGADGEVKRPTPFEIYTPLFFANIQGLEDVLEDRAITRILLRALNHEISRREPSITDPRWAKIRSGLYRLYLECAAEVAQMASGVSGASGVNGGILEGRELELWHPILTLAQFFEKHGVSGLIERITSLAVEVGCYKQEENLTESTDMLLLQVLRELVKEEGYYSVSQIKTKLIELVADDVKTPPKWLTSQWLGRALKRARIGKRRKLGTHREYFITPRQVMDLITRVGADLIESTPPSEMTPQTPHPPLTPPVHPLVPEDGTRKIALQEKKEAKE